MERFSPERSKIFSAAVFVNVYSTFSVEIARVLLSITLVMALILTSIGGLSNTFLLILGISITFFVFEIFYRAKILNEKPQAIKDSQNLANTFSMEAARFALQNKDRKTLSDLLVSFLKDRQIQYALYRADFGGEDLKNLSAKQTEEIAWNDLAQNAKVWSEKEKRTFIDKLDILLATISQSKSFQKFLFDKEIKEPDLLNIIYWVRSSYEKDQQPFFEKPVSSLGPGMAEFWLGGWTLETEKYTADITHEMRKSRFSTHLIGRKEQVQLVEEVLSRDKKRNVILLGSPGIGKTTIIYSLAEKSISGLLPPALEYKRFMEIDITSLLAGASGGELEQRIQNLLTEVSHAGNVVLFMPNLENLAGASGTGVNITGHLLNALGSGKLQVIATSSREDYHRYVESQTAFSSLFEVIDIPEATNESTIRILEEATPAIEHKNKLVITYKSLQKVVELSDKYIVDRQLPGKAIDLLDEAATAVSIKNKGLLEPSDVEEVVSQKTKIPVGKAKIAEAKQLLNLENILHQSIIDQNEAIVAISNALRRSRTIERESKRPIGVFLFLGPTGVGKTETAKTLAKYYFKSESSIIRVDMSEFQDRQSLNRLIGAPPGSEEHEEGGELTEKVRQNPYSLILLDEMEKAEKSVQEAFLPIFDEGVMQDTSGRKIVFTNTMIIATSNAGAEFIRESIQSGVGVDDFKKQLLEKLQRESVFKPEFLNRFDDIIVYKPLSPQEVEQVVTLMISDLGQRLKKQDIDISTGQEAIKLIAEKGFDPTYGARPLRRFIADNIEEKIAEKILSGEIKKGSQVGIRATNGNLLIQ